LGRGEWSVKDTGPAEEIPTAEAPPTQPKQEDPKQERKLRFRLIKFQEMRPGLEPSYLVDELIPSAGLVLVWGKCKKLSNPFGSSICLFMWPWAGPIAITPYGKDW
jgi:hypothetical protein